MLKTNIQKHIKVKHSQEEQVECPQCGKAFKTSYYMKDHLRNIHGVGQRLGYWNAFLNFIIFLTLSL